MNPINLRTLLNSTLRNLYSQGSPKRRWLLGSFLTATLNQALSRRWKRFLKVERFGHEVVLANQFMWFLKTDLGIC